jgi:hypothetical protein
MTTAGCRSSREDVGWRLVIGTALTCLGMTGEQALAHLRQRRPGAPFNDRFAAHLQGLPARRIRVERV